MSGNCLFSKLLKELEISYTAGYAAKRYEEHPYKYTLYGLSQLLDEYKIESKGLRLEHKEDIHLLSAPFLAQVSEDIVVVTAITDEHITYDWYGEQIKADHKHFNDLWSGVILQAIPNENSSEPELKEHRKADWIKLGKKITAFSCLGVVCVLTFLQHHHYASWPINALLLINGCGLYISLLLLLKQLNIQSNTADRICNLLKHSSCNNVLETGAAKFLGIVSWSEIGFTFFAVNLFVLLFVPSVLVCLAIISVCALPYTFWSVWYQKFRAKQWCTLCLVVQALIWLQFLVFCTDCSSLSLSRFSPFDVLNLISLYAGFVSALNLSLPFIVQSKQMLYWKQAFAYLRIKDEVFFTLLEKQSYYEVGKDASSLLFGNPESNLRITVFSNPYCNPCARMHERLHQFDEKNCCIQYIFTSFREEWNDINKFLIAAYLTYSADKAM